MADQKRRLWKELFPETQIFFVGVLRHADDDSAIGFQNSHKKSALPCRVGTQKIIEK